ncbi:30S ribosomal protein S10 [Halopenitus salinus]|jgi:ribosomal protein S10|uniref:Small ribosomal subunit protein uS10 n=1 Tax=Halopenitus salinus TaxID=1198295 RepID=A0ABD5UW11_9EURY
MTFVTKLSFESGDRAVLEETVEDLKRTVERKGAECKGPHASSPEHARVQLYKRLAPGDQFSPWEYTVYGRRLEIHGSDDVAREMVDREFPDSIHVEVEVDRKKPLGHGRE